MLMGMNTSSLVAKPTGRFPEHEQVFLRRATVALPNACRTAK
jgi:hypothetical protein